MAHFFPLRLVAGGRWLLAILLLLAAPVARAQAPGWGGAVAGVSGSANDYSQIQAVTTDASGNVFVAGYFFGTLTLGSTVLTSAGINDMFVAKYVPATGTWAWAQRGGGTQLDYAGGIAVSGTSVYVTGTFTNDSGNGNAVFFGTTPVNGTGALPTTDLFLAKYTDNGPSATLNWTQIGGGTSLDGGYGVAVSGTSVYVAGYFTNNLSNSNSVAFGGNGSAAGTVVVNGASTLSNPDLLLAKYTDNGTTATLAWTQVAGGRGYDYGNGVAVSGTSVYVAGILNNDAANSQGALFGGGGTTAGTSAQSGASATTSTDLLLAKYTDNGTTGTFIWSQVGGGTSSDQGNGVAVSGSSVYVTGFITNSTTNASGVLFGGKGTTAGTAVVNGATSTVSPDVLLAKYIDAGSSATLTWTQVGGGTGGDGGYGLAVSGTSLFVTGQLANSTTNASGVLFGGNGTTAGTATVPGATTTNNTDVLLAKYTDNGATGTYNWAQAGGSPSFESGFGVAVRGQQVYTGGYALAPATFGPTTFTTPAGGSFAVLAYLADATLLATHPAAPAGTAGLALYPNPATSGAATLTGASPGAAVQVLDALGRLVRTTTADATGTATLTSLPAGLYVVRAGTATRRLSIE